MESEKTEIVYSGAISLDGYIADADGGVDWLHESMVKGESYGLDTFMASIDAVLMGSATFEKSLALGARFGKKTPTWVFTRRPFAHKNVTFTSASPAVVAEDLTRRGLRRAWLMGGGRLASSFLTAGLIDELSLGVMPVVLGAGIPLFAGGIAPTHLTLVECTQYKGGALGLRYTPARKRPG
jgi:dihydrofolate reductase